MTTPKEQYVYSLRDGQRILETGTAETLSEFCTGRDLIPLHCFHYCAMVTGKNNRIFGVTWEARAVNTIDAVTAQRDALLAACKVAADYIHHWPASEPKNRALEKIAEAIAFCAEGGAK